MSSDSDIRIGNVVLSTAGRDKKRVFMVIAVESPDYVLLSDGETHKLANAKRKKVKHIKLMTCNTVSAELIASVAANRALDADIRKALSAFRDVSADV